MKKSKFINLVIVLLIVLFISSCKAKQTEPKIYKVGILQLTDFLKDVEDGFKEKMTSYGYKENENIFYDHYNANGNTDNLGDLSKKLIENKPDLIVTITTPASVAAMQASKGKDIPILFILVSDPLRAGLVKSYKQPGGWITGVRDGAALSVGKRLELLKMMDPEIKKVLSVYSFEDSLLPAQDLLREAAVKLDIILVERQVHTSSEAAEIFNSIQQGEVDAIFIPSDGIISDAAEALKILALKYGLPYIFPGKSGNILAQYGENIFKVGTQGATIADKILKGSDPGYIPVELSKDFILTINLSVAENLGLSLSNDILSLADHIIK